MFFWVWSYNTDSIQSGRLNDKPNIDMGKNLVKENDSVIQIHWHPSWWPNSVDWKIWILATWNDMNSNFSCILGNLWKIGIHFDKIYSKSDFYNIFSRSTPIIISEGKHLIHQVLSKKIIDQTMRMSIIFPWAIFTCIQHSFSYTNNKQVSKLSKHILITWHICDHHIWKWEKDPFLSFTKSAFSSNVE